MLEDRHIEYFGDGKRTVGLSFPTDHPDRHRLYALARRYADKLLAREASREQDDA